jgi:hypothetical protein
MHGFNSLLRPAETVIVKASRPSCKRISVVNARFRCKARIAKLDSYASFKACAISAIRSDGCSMPIESRIVESRTPIF